MSAGGNSGEKLTFMMDLRGSGYHSPQKVAGE